MTDQTTSGPTGFNTDEIADLAMLGAKVEDTLANLEKYIKALNIFTEWNGTITALKAETGVAFTYFDSPYHEDRYNWEMSLTSHGIEFTAFDRDGDRLGFFMPFTFLSPQTRPKCIEDLRTKYAAQATRQAEVKRAEREKERDRAERALAKAQADLAAIDRP